MMRIFFTLPCHKKQARQLSKRPAKESPEGTTGSYLQSPLPWLGCAQLVPVVGLLHISKSPDLNSNGILLFWAINGQGRDITPV